VQARRHSRDFEPATRPGTAHLAQRDAAGLDLTVETDQKVEGGYRNFDNYRLRDAPRPSGTGA